MKANKENVPHPAVHRRHRRRRQIRLQEHWKIIAGIIVVDVIFMILRMTILFWCEKKDTISI